VTLRRLVAGLGALACVVILGVPAGAQEPEPDTTTTLTPGAEAPHIIPRPNSGAEPQEAGDRGGALQLGLLGLLVVVIGGAVVVVVRQSQRARSDRQG
jgi:uncharacterized protein HemX